MTEYRPLNTSPEPVRLRIEDYLLLDGAGALDSYAKTELIEGQIVSMNVQHRPHGMVKMELYDRLRDVLIRLGSPLRPVIEFSVSIPPDAMPEPDILLTNEPRGDGAVPLASVALIIEVSDTTLAFDLGPKAALYARSGVPEYWVADVSARRIHQHASPSANGYGRIVDHAFGDSIASITLSGVTVDTSAIG